MRKYSPVRDIVACLLLVLAILAAVLFLPRSGQALVRMPPDVALWRILVHEASLPAWDEDSETWVSRRTGRPWGDDAYLIHEVLLRGVDREGGRLSYIEFAQAYAHRMFDPLSDVERTRVQLGLPLVGNRWAGFLETSLRQPRAWDEGAWSSHREAASYALELARDVVQFDLRALEEFSPCADPVDDWGGRTDGERARSLGLIPVDCGPNAANTGYARPSQVRARALTPRVDPD